ncbi:hypothetical protein EDC04DRAFT_1074013 [Pisolithus marmoratus]|nr:hypothetical protein EDC04DRAFT_1074013 [Pisolithus marmoratus]
MSCVILCQGFSYVLIMIFLEFRGFASTSPSRQLTIALHYPIHTHSSVFFMSASLYLWKHFYL